MAPPRVLDGIRGYLLRSTGTAATKEVLPVDITIYLPDEIADRAKRQNVNLSRLLRDALAAQFQQEDAMAKTLEGASQVVLQLENEDGRTYKGRITATKIAGSGDVEVFLTEEENVVVYEENKCKYSVCEDPEEDLRGWLTDDQYIEAMNALGIEPTVDLDI